MVTVHQSITKDIYIAYDSLNDAAYGFLKMFGFFFGVFIIFFGLAKYNTYNYYRI